MTEVAQFTVLALLTFLGVTILKKLLCNISVNKNDILPLNMLGILELIT